MRRLAAWSARGMRVAVRPEAGPTLWRYRSVYGAGARKSRRDPEVQQVLGVTRLIVWHDGGCPLCRREIALMRRLDRRGRIDFVDLMQLPAASCPIDRAEMLARFHASENGQLLSGAAAFAAMWRAIPLLRPLGLAARSPWLLAKLETLYLLFLRFRPRLQRVFAKGRGT